MHFKEESDWCDFEKILENKKVLNSPVEEKASELLLDAIQNKLR